VPEYRAYFVGDDGHLDGFEPLICDNDDDAAAKARALLDTKDIEFWSGERLVKHLSAAEKSGGEAVSHEIKDGRMVPKK
jgi:hypothetical protein